MTSSVPAIPEIDPEQNAAVRQHVHLTPKMLEQIVDNPAAAQPLFRSMTMINFAELWNARLDLTPAQRMVLAEYSAKMGDMHPKANAGPTAGSGYSLTINIGPAGQDRQTITVENPVQQVTDDADV